MAVLTSTPRLAVRTIEVELYHWVGTPTQKTFQFFYSFRSAFPL